MTELAEKTMTTKIKSAQKENANIVGGRDLFQTPNYATNLLIPFLMDVGLRYNRFRIWECACGNGKITKRLINSGLDVFGTDLSSEYPFNFLTQNQISDFQCIVTNPPYSLKKKFYEKCLQYKVSFALLIPADYSGWVIDALQNGAEKIIPTRRIDFITPTGKSGLTGQSANFHSLWLTWGFGLGKSETFVELTKEMKKNI
jgi:hypothetical protein